MVDIKTRTVGRLETRTNLVNVAARLLREQGPTAVTTRAVAEAAGVQPPTIYRLFGDKDGLLDAVAEHVLATFVADKAVLGDSPDPVADLRTGWEMYISFGLANPSVFRLLTDTARGTPSPAAVAGMDVLRRRVHRVAAIGRLQVPERRAVELVHGGGIGAVLMLLSLPPEQRDPGLAEAMYQAVMRAVLTDVPAFSDDGAVAASVAFRTVVPHLEVLTDTEQALLIEWLDRVPG